MLQSPKNKHLGIVHIQTRMLSGGAEENTWASCVHQAKLGHDVHLICGRDSNYVYYQKNEFNIKVHYVPSLVREIAWNYDLRAYKDIKSVLMKINPDVVHTHTSKASIIGKVAAKRADVPSIIHGVHMLPFVNVTTLQRAIYKIAEHATAWITDHYVHVSDGTKEAYLKEGIGAKKPHTVVRSGMDVDQYRNGKIPSDWRGLLGMEVEDEKPKVILMMAALEKRKRHKEFISGFLKELKEDDKVVVVLAGSGPELNEISNFIKERKAEKVVRLVGHRNDPEKLVALADVCVLSSLREGLPRVIVQSLAGGIPAIVNYLPGIEEIICDGENGVIVKNNCAELVAEEALALVRDELRLARMSEAAKKSNVSDWSFSAMFKQLDQAYAAVYN